VPLVFTGFSFPVPVAAWSNTWNSIDVNDEVGWARTGVPNVPMTLHFGSN